MRLSKSVSVFSLCLLAATASAQVTITPSAGSFLDISTSGNVLGPAGDDTAHGFTSTIGNSMLPAGPIVVTSNGCIIAGAVPGSSVFGNAAIAATSTATAVGYTAGQSVLCPWWDDLYAVGAPSGTLYWQEIGSILYIQFQNIGHFATSSAAGGPAITFQVQVFAGACGSPDLIRVMYPDATFGGAQAANDAGASATVGFIGATTVDNAQFSFNTIASIPDGTVLDFTRAGLFTANFTSPLGIGSLLYSVCNGTPLGQYQLLVTLNAGAFPNGWLYGIDITFGEVTGQLGVFPFLGPLDGVGNFSLGPFTGLPSGLTLYSITFDVPAGLPSTTRTPASAYTIP